MTTQYRNVPMKFDGETFSHDLSCEVNAIVRDTSYTVDEIAVVLLDVHQSTLKRWMTNSTTNGELISMGNYIRICNIFGLNTAKYWILES